MGPSQEVKLSTNNLKAQLRYMFGVWDMQTKDMQTAVKMQEQDISP